MQEETKETDIIALLIEGYDGVLSWFSKVVQRCLEKGRCFKDLFLMNPQEESCSDSEEARLFSMFLRMGSMAPSASSVHSLSTLIVLVFYSMIGQDMPLKPKSCSLSIGLLPFHNDPSSNENVHVNAIHSMASAWIRTCPLWHEPSPKEMKVMKRRYGVTMTKYLLLFLLWSLAFAFYVFYFYLEDSFCVCIILFLISVFLFVCSCRA